MPIASGALEVMRSYALLPEGLLHTLQVLVHTPVDGCKHWLQIVCAAPYLKQNIWNSIEAVVTPLLIMCHAVPALRHHILHLQPGVAWQRVP